MDGFDELTLELTDWCPSECLHCSSRSSPKCRNYLSEVIAVRLVEEAAQLGARKISFGGGEPGAVDCLMSMLKRVVGLGISAEVFTCGVVREGGNVRALPYGILRACKDLRGVKFIFSFHGASASVHDHVSKTPRSFELLMDSVEECLSAGVNCEINFVPTRVNTHEFEELVELAEGLSIKRISVLRFVPQGRGFENRLELELSSEEEELFVERLMRLRYERRVDIRTGSPFNGIVPGNAVPCRAGFGKLVVQANGNVIPCEVFKHRDRCNWGLSVYKQSLREILDSPRVSALRKKLAESNCMECPVHGGIGIAREREGRHAISGAATHVE